MKKPQIGITIKIDSDNYSLWAAGNRLNIFFLADTLMRSGAFDVRIVNTEGRKIVPKPALSSWDRDKYVLSHFDEVRETLDVLVVVGSELSDKDTHYLKSRGCRLVYYVAGNRYIMDMEDILFKGGRNPRQDQSCFDEFWMIPQMTNTCDHYIRLIYGGRIRHVPFVWNSEFLDRIAPAVPNKGRYVPGRAKKRVSCFEPNINVVKYVMYDFLVAEEAYRQRPELLHILLATNSIKLVQNPAFMSLALKLSIVRDKKASFEGRYLMPLFLGRFTDVVLAHQWENALNYAYLDALYLGFPLVHNAHFIKDAGYYYEGFDVPTGAAQLIRAMESHDQHIEEEAARNEPILERYRSSNPEVIEAYRKIVENCLAGRD